MRSRRRSRRGRSQSRNNNKLNFTPVIVLLCLSIGCGYAAAKYVVDPVVNYVPQIGAEKNDEAANTSVTEESKESDVVEDEADIIEKDKITGYALQFGCYSSKNAADTVLPTIAVEGLQVIEQDDMYKIIGEVYKTKTEAKTALENMPDTVKSFITPIYE